MSELQRDHARRTRRGAALRPARRGLGSVSRVLPVPGLAEHGVGFKTLPDAIALRNRALLHLEIAESMDDPELRRPWLTFVFVGAGYAGLEGIAELQDYVADVIDRYPRCRLDGTRFILVEAEDRVMQEIPAEAGRVRHPGAARARDGDPHGHTARRGHRGHGRALDGRARARPHGVLDDRREAVAGGGAARPAPRRRRAGSRPTPPCGWRAARTCGRSATPRRSPTRPARGGPPRPPPSTRCGRGRWWARTWPPRSPAGRCASSATARSACSWTWASTRPWPPCSASGCAGSRRGSRPAPTT